MSFRVYARPRSGGTPVLVAACLTDDMAHAAAVALVENMRTHVANVEAPDGTPLASHWWARGPRRAYTPL